MSQYHDQLQKVIGDQEALKQLETEAKSPEEAAYLNEVQDEIQHTREHLGDYATKVVLTPDGTAESQQAVHNELEAGHDRPGVYHGGGGRE